MCLCQAFSQCCPALNPHKLYVKYLHLTTALKVGQVQHAAKTASMRCIFHALHIGETPWLMSQTSSFLPQLASAGASFHPALRKRKSATKAFPRDMLQRTPAQAEDHVLQP